MPKKDFVDILARVYLQIPSHVQTYISKPRKTRTKSRDVSMTLKNGDCLAGMVGF